MIYTLKDLKHLNVMADLINAEPIKPTQIDIGALLGADNKHSMTAEERILSLCSKLRADGFELQADSLESKFVTYKIATTHLYRVIDEDGEDLIHSAHPDGDVKVEEASDGLGEVGTVVSKHRKIVDMVQREPTGKLAKYVGACVAILEKNSQIVDPASALVYDIYKIWTGFKQSFGDIRDKSELLKDHLETLLGDENAQKFKNLISQINIVIPALNKAMSIGPQIERLRVQPEGKVAEVKKYKTFFEQLQNALSNLKSTILTASDASENSASSKLYHVFVSSNFSNAKMSINELNKSLSKMISSLDSLDTSGESKSPATGPINLNLEEGSSVSSKQTEIDKLNGWKNKLSVSTKETTQKEHINKWIDGQITELQNATTSEQVAKVVEENKRFEAQGLI